MRLRIVAAALALFFSTPAMAQLTPQQKATIEVFMMTSKPVLLLLRDSMLQCATTDQAAQQVLSVKVLTEVGSREVTQTTVQATSILAMSSAFSASRMDVIRMAISVIAEKYKVDLDTLRAETRQMSNAMFGRTLARYSDIDEYDDFITAYQNDSQTCGKAIGEITNRLGDDRPKRGRDG